MKKNAASKLIYHFFLFIYFLPLLDTKPFSAGTGLMCQKTVCKINGQTLFLQQNTVIFTVKIV